MNETKKLLNNLIPEEIDLGYYLYEYGNGDWIKYGIDLVAIWQAIDYEFDTSMRCPFLLGGIK